MRAARIDANQPEIVEALRRVGAKVQPVHMVGHGFPDVVAYYRGRVYLLEIKTPSGRLTLDERCWHDAWPGCAHIVRSVDEALAVIGAVDYETDQRPASDDGAAV